MSKLLLPILLFSVGILFLKRICEEKKTLSVCIALLLFSSVCFFLYLNGKIGVGFPSILLDLLGKAG